MSTADDVPFVTPDSPALAERCATLGNYYIVAAHSHDVLARHVNVEQLPARPGRAARERRRRGRLNETPGGEVPSGGVVNAWR